ncbi:Plasmodium exported protein (Pm-fam-a like), unknown function [Plasmodium malariae]|uniref:Uncharacterized protein n=1 Tax=Plasmodium malariae TaxID=5858 RepID=A0A1A8XA72_PLAMA|nr:Plasmodium exported protein (Pm-fam-a like), unknown function [Plasmodium malariae]
MSRFNKILDEEYGFDRKLDIRIYRLLGIYLENIYPYVKDLELKIPYNTKKKSEKLFTIDNEKWDREKKEKLYRSLLYKEKLIKKLKKNKCTMLHKSYDHYEKKIMNGLDDKAFFKKMILINDMDYKKLKRKKYRLRIFLLLLLFILVLILPILDLSLGKFKSIGSLVGEICKLVNGTASSLPNPNPTVDSCTFWSIICDMSNISETYKAVGILIYSLPILILAIILILGVFFYYKKVIKHKKIKYLEAFNEW